jgi:hypothetical protein
LLATFVIPIRHSHRHTRKKRKGFRSLSSILCSQRDRDRETIAANSISVFGEKNFLLYSERERERERDRETIATEESIIALEKTTVDCNEVDRFVGEKGNFSIIFLLFF